MRITHFGHACTLIETPSARLLIDPGTFSADFEGVRGLDAVLITHQHADHLDTDRLPRLLEANPEARLVTDPASAADLIAMGVTAETARPGDALEVSGASVNVVGGEHAVIHPDIATIANTGFVIDHGAFYHPGDAFHVPDQRIDVLGLPTGAPWLKASEAVEFLRAVAPRATVPIHEAVLAVPELHYGLFERLGPPGTSVHVLTRGEPSTV